VAAAYITLPSGETAVTHPDAVVHVYGEFVRRPYFALVHSRPRPGHERFDQYNPGNLTELMLSVVEHLGAGRPEMLEKMCALDAADATKTQGRTRRYIAKRREDLYGDDSQHLASHSVEFRGHWFNTNAKHTQTQTVVRLACRACDVPYSSIRALKGFRSDG